MLREQEVMTTEVIVTTFDEVEGVVVAAVLVAADCGLGDAVRAPYVLLTTRAW